MTIRGVLLDSGDTLIQPVGGRWNPRFDFEDVLVSHVPAVDRTRFAEAFAAGDRFLRDAPATAPRDDYHRVILHHLGIERPSAALLTDLDAPLKRPPVEPFLDVRDVLQRLRAEGIKLAIVSDNWPTLEGLYVDLALRDFFDAFVISANLGCCKPDPRMYETARDQLGLPAHECLFVDDDPTLVSAALALGYQGVAIDRDGSRTHDADVEWIRSCYELLPLVVPVDNEKGT